MFDKLKNIIPGMGNNKEEKEKENEGVDNERQEEVKENDDGTPAGDDGGSTFGRIKAMFSGNNKSGDKKERPTNESKKKKKENSVVERLKQVIEDLKDRFGSGDKEDKPKKSQAEIEKENEKKYLKDGEDYYPYYQATQVVWAIRRWYTKFLFLVGFVYLGMLLADMAILPAILFLWYGLKMVWLWFNNMSHPQIGEVVSMEILKEQVDETAAVFSRFMETFRPIGIAINLLLVLGVIWGIYLVFIALRKHHGEISPIHNDRLSKRIKDESIKALNAERRLTKETDGKGNKKERYKNKTEMYAVQAIRGMEVEVHARKDVNGVYYRQKASIKISQPQRVDVRKELLSKLDDAQGVFTASSKGELTFKEFESQSTRENFIWRAENDITDRIKAEREKKKQKKQEKRKESEWAIPLDMFVDRQDKIDEQTAKAKEFGENTEKSINVYFSSSDIQAQLASMDVGNSTVAFRYKMRTIKFQLNTIEEEIIRALDDDGIQVKAEAGDVVVSVPLPDDRKIPMDVRTMLEEEF